MHEQCAHKVTFILQILDTQNGSWQGTVTWAGSNRPVQYFRSELELLKLMDSVISPEPDEGSKAVPN